MKNGKQIEKTAQNVINAIVTLTRAGLLSWKDNTVQLTLALDADNLLLSHIHDVHDADEDAGIHLMHVTRKQAGSITEAIEFTQQLTVDELIARNAAAARA